MNEAVFFIPVLTPRYFRSEPCREEFRAFVTKARQLGATERILSLIYIRVQHMSVESDDDLIKWAASYQHRDVSQLRWMDMLGTDMRRLANLIAQELVDLEAALPSPMDIEFDETNKTDETPSVLEKSDIAKNVDLVRRNDGPGEVYQDLFSIAQEVLPILLNSVEDFTARLAEVYDLTSQYVGPLQNTTTASMKLSVLTRYGDEIKRPAASLYEAAEQFTSGIEDVDTGLQAIFRWPSAELSNIDIQEKQVLASQVQELKRRLIEARSQVRNFSETIAEILAVSKIVKMPLGRLDNALLIFIDGQAIVDRWSFS